MKVRLSRKSVIVFVTINIVLLSTLAFLGNSCSQGFKIPGAESLSSSSRVQGVNPSEFFISGGTLLTIQGKDLSSVTEVLIGGAPCSDLQIVGPETLNCRAPQAEEGAMDITLIDPQGEEVLSGLLTARDFTRVDSIAGRSGLVGRLDGVGTLARFGHLEAAILVGDDIYLADRYYHQIIKFETATGNVTAIAGMNTGGDNSNESADGIGTAARFDRPHGLASDGMFLYISDWNNSTIRKLNLATKEVTTFAGTAGQTGFVDGIGAAARFYAPTA
ncbi:MAG: IPT/TIG domain-containing protein, partial [Bdellovibrionia bacterium]